MNKQVRQLHRQQERLRRKIGRRSIEIFTDPSHPASFSHPENVYRALRAEGHGLEHATLHAVKQALAQIPAYSKHREIQRKFPQMTTRSDDADERWQLDLMNVVSFRPEENDGFAYLLMLIDVFSRRLVVVPLYDRSCTEVTAATELVFMTTGRIPKSITSDSGQEFKGNALKALCRKYGIDQYFTISDKTHASIVERVIRTLRTRIGKFMTHTDSKRYIDHLSELVNNYNNTVHSSLGMTPNEAGSTVENRQLALFHQKHRLNDSKKNRRHRRRNSPTPFHEGDVTRIPRPFKRFRKAHEPSFGDHSYVVTQAFKSDKARPVFRLRAQAPNTPSAGKPVYYSNELSLVK